MTDNDYRYRRAQAERAFAQMTLEEQDRILSAIAALFVRLGFDVPDELRERLRKEGNPLASVYVN